MSRIRKEEYTVLGDFVKASFVRDQAEIMMRFPKLDVAFLEDFSQQLQDVKILESGLVLTERQKAVTASLYAEVAILNKELNFLTSYIAAAGLDSGAIMGLKKELFARNIEGGILKIEGVKQFLAANIGALSSEGMSAAFPAKLQVHKLSLAEKNALQNSFMNNRKMLTDSNKTQYKALFGSIATITRAGKLVFDGTVKKDEYTVSRVIGRMRAPKHHEAVVAVS